MILSNRIAHKLSPVKKVGLAAAGMTVLTLPIAIGMVNALPIRAQPAAGVTPRFEVTSVKPCQGERGLESRAGDTSPGRLSTGCDFLVDDNNLGLIQRAYVRFAGGHANPIGVLAIKGGPKWVHSDMYKIDARAEGKPSREMMLGPMLQALLEDRFRLKIHREAEERPVYALTVAKGGSKLKAFREGSCVQIPLTRPLPPLEPGRKYCDNMISARNPSLDAEAITMKDFSKLLDLIVDRSVVDETGMSGKYDIHLKFSRDEVTTGLREPPPGASAPIGPTIFAAIQEQLGLKLVSTKGPVEFLVIDHVEKPSAN